ncbi:GREB1-related protein [Limosilactobacillus reuteri]|uniref:GREB1-related protein n=1 Tax=Limosilactobacillus reuteri TaxID=1598 RepID=UPI001E313007|nr:hypothetical protein [Limosilactobacillus reuteri]MCC4518118.1 hypothetical protein [Limosilactobacillus reuteri]
MSNEVLIAEISGKRPGTKEDRPTEKFNFDWDKVIISNNSEGYETDWPVINVPNDYQEWYKEHAKMSESAYYAPMNRSYAIKYAREHGYKYLVQLDDNIISFNIRYAVGDKSYTTLVSTPNIEELPQDMFRYFKTVLDNTNAGIVGMTLAGASLPSSDWLRERYVYSAFMLKLDSIPDYYQGDFEDDIEFRLKLKEMQIPSLMVCPFQYIKTAQGDNKDLTGNRKAYKDAGLKRGEHMSKIHGDMYSRGWSSRGSGVKRKRGVKKFRHKVKPFKVGARVSNINELKQGILDLFAKYATPRKDVVKYKQQ